MSAGADGDPGGGTDGASERAPGAPPAHARDAPGSLRFVVPFGRDGASDRVARAVAQALEREGLAVEVENVPGGGGRDGLIAAANRAASSAVLLLGTPSTHVLAPALDPRSWAKVRRAARWETLLGLGCAPNVLLVSRRLGVDSVAGLCALAREAREPLVYASAGSNQTIHLCGAAFCRLAGVTMRHRPYAGGSALAYTDLIAGRTHVYFDNLIGCAQRVAAGDLIALAVSSERRVAIWPELPTLVELGFPGHSFDVWFALFGANLGGAQRRALGAIAADPALGAALRAHGLDGGTARADAANAAIEASSARWLAALRIAAESARS